MNDLTFTAELGDSGQRLDKWLMSKDIELTRSALQKLIEERKVAVNGKAESKSRDSFHTQTVFIHMPVKRVGPFGKAKICSQILDIMDIKRFPALSIGVKLFVQLIDKVASAMNIAHISVSKQPEKGLFKIILNNRAMVSFLKGFPHHAKMGKLRF